MNQTLLITGATGQVGRRFVEGLSPEARSSAIALVRSRDTILPIATRQCAFEDLAQHPEILEGVDDVLHLAAHMGKGSIRLHRKVNTEGTAHLLRASEKAGVRRFCFVSSIAAQFSRRFLQPYPYATSKVEAEALVKASSLETIILRPTLILGAGMSGYVGLSKLAKLPLTPLFGNAELQPIDVDDAALALSHVFQHEVFDGRVLDLGGPTRLFMSDLLTMIREQSRGLGRPRFLPLPGTLIAMALGMVEPVLRPILPLTAGQLQTFLQAGTASSNSLMESIGTTMTQLDETLAGASLDD